MTQMTDQTPFERHAWPKHIEAHALEQAPVARLFGYEIDSDLAKHYSFAELVLLSLTGELSSDAVGKAFECLLFHAATLSVADAPMHAAVLARLCGARTGGVLGVAAMALGEQVETPVATILVELKNGKLEPDHRAASGAERARVTRLAGSISSLLDVPALTLDPSYDVALVACMWACGLRDSARIVAALCLARLPLACAEVFCTKPGDFKTYPIDTPHFEYVAPVKESR